MGHTQSSLQAWLAQLAVVMLQPPRNPERAEQSSSTIGPGRQELSSLDRRTGAEHAFWACLAMPDLDAGPFGARDWPQSRISGLLAPPRGRPSTASLWRSLAASPRKARCDYGPHGRSQAGRKDHLHTHSSEGSVLKPPPVRLYGGAWSAHMAVWLGIERKWVSWIRPHPAGGAMGSRSLPGFLPTASEFSKPLPPIQA